MTFQSDPKPAPRIVDPAAVSRARLRRTGCVACGAEPGGAHHVIPRSERGDDVEENIVLLCGHGTSRCHGAFHGNPYVHTHNFTNWRRSRTERRDRDWVARRIGVHLLAHRPDVIAGVLGKLGDSAGRDYLRRVYLLQVPSEVSSSP